MFKFISSALPRAIALKSTLVFALVLAGIAHAPSAQADVAVPGQSVGKIRLGDSRAVVLRRLGKPTKSARWKSGYRQDSWLGKKPPVDKDGMEIGTRTTLNVIYSRDKVVQIEFNSPSFVTPQGISPASNLGQFRRTYSGVKPRAVAYLEGGGGYVGYYYDSKVRGIAFTFGTQDYFDPRIKPELLRVHRPGFPVLADPGGQPAKANDEVPDVNKVH